MSGASSATSAHDGDGNPVKSTIDGTTTYFVGNIYENTEGVATKYYYAGETRIAMRVGSGDPYYLLSDHLGSTTVVTDASGDLVSELRYKPWGEVRDATGTTPTDYTFTGPLRLTPQGLALAAGSGRAAQYSNTGEPPLPEKSGISPGWARCEQHTAQVANPGERSRMDLG